MSDFTYHLTAVQARAIEFAVKWTSQNLRPTGPVQPTLAATLETLVGMVERFDFRPSDYDGFSIVMPVKRPAFAVGDRVKHKDGRVMTVTGYPLVECDGQAYASAHVEKVSPSDEKPCSG